MSRQITLTLGILRDLMFGFDALADVRAESVTDSGPETYFPVIVPKAIGKLLDDLNTDNLFVIFHFDEHSEVWHRQHWQDSNSRRWQLVIKAAASSEEYLARQAEITARQMKLAAIKQLITKQWSAFEAPLMDSELNKLALTLSRFPREQCNLIPGLLEILYGS